MHILGLKWRLLLIFASLLPSSYHLPNCSQLVFVARVVEASLRCGLCGCGRGIVDGGSVPVGREAWAGGSIGKWECRLSGVDAGAEGCGESELTPREGCGGDRAECIADAGTYGCAPDLTLAGVDVAGAESGVQVRRLGTDVGPGARCIAGVGAEWESARTSVLGVRSFGARSARASRVPEAAVSTTALDTGPFLVHEHFDRIPGPPLCNGILRGFEWGPNRLDGISKMSRGVGRVLSLAFLASRAAGFTTTNESRKSSQLVVNASPVPSQSSRGASGRDTGRKTHTVRRVLLVAAAVTRSVRSGARRESIRRSVRSHCLTGDGTRRDAMRVARLARLHFAKERAGARDGEAFESGLFCIAGMLDATGGVLGAYSRTAPFLLEDYRQSFNHTRPALWIRCFYACRCVLRDRRNNSWSRVRAQDCRITLRGSLAMGRGRHGAKKDDEYKLYTCIHLLRCRGLRLGVEWVQMKVHIPPVLKLDSSEEGGGRGWMGSADSLPAMALSLSTRLSNASVPVEPLGDVPFVCFIANAKHSTSVWPPHEDFSLCEARRLHLAVRLVSNSRCNIAASAGVCSGSSMRDFASISICVAMGRALFCFVFPLVFSVACLESSPHVDIIRFAGSDSYPV
ncbi:hypothetical protein B0H12DRAFT_1069874 [Mycena haematopus]|nr:hypothetical protein B0H12DRAFT_1069874 [Mycena haematopus]